MRVYGMLFSALATAAMTGPLGASSAKPSTIAVVDVTRNLPAGSYAGVAYRYVEGVIHGEVSATESVAGLSALAAGRATIPYEIAFHIVAPESASEADAVIVEAPNRGNNILARTIGVPSAPTADQGDGIS